jgi:lipopolysaccharide export system protein LptA
VVTQPNRRAAGDYAQYNAADEIVILRGNPARIEDAETGSSQGGQVTVYLRENRVVGEGKTKQNGTGRIRSVYKVKNN